MKKAAFTAFVVFSLFALAFVFGPSQRAMACGPSCASHGAHGGQGPAKTQVTYTCPMHPDVTSDKPGKCPKCGMFLEAGANQPASEQPPAAHSGHSH